MSGEINVDAMLRRITAKQFRDWQYYAQLEPFGELREDYRNAHIIQTILNMMRGKDQELVTLEDCLLQFGEPVSKNKQTWEDKLMLARLMAAQAAARPRDK